MMVSRTWLIVDVILTAAVAVVGTIAVAMPRSLVLPIPAGTVFTAPEGFSIDVPGNASGRLVGAWTSPGLVCVRHGTRFQTGGPADFGCYSTSDFGHEGSFNDSVQGPMPTINYVFMTLGQPAPVTVTQTIRVVY